jgi:sulfite exporter TauE/SafE
MNLARPIMARNSSASRYALGILLGFMPCGMVIAAIMTVVALDNPAKAALGMGLFALGTVPALILVATGGHILNTSFPQTAPAVRFTMLMLSTAVLIITAGKMLLS